MDIWLICIFSIVPKDAMHSIYCLQYFNSIPFHLEPNFNSLLCPPKSLCGLDSAYLSDLVSPTSLLLPGAFQFLKKVRIAKETPSPSP